MLDAGGDAKIGFEVKAAFNGLLLLPRLKSFKDNGGLLKAVTGGDTPPMGGTVMLGAKPDGAIRSKADVTSSLLGLTSTTRGADGGGLSTTSIHFSCWLLEIMAAIVKTMNLKVTFL